MCTSSQVLLYEMNYIPPKKVWLLTLFTSAPAQYYVASKLIKLTSAIGNTVTPYQGARNETNNALWSDLYKYMNTHIAYEEASIMPNKTAPEVEADGGGYPIILNMFHDIHCLDSIRKTLWFWLEAHWNSTHNPFTLYDTPFDALRNRGDIFETNHIDHCIDNIRQSIICNVDITPNVFQYSKEYGEIRARATVVYECRDYDLVIELAEKH